MATKRKASELEDEFALFSREIASLPTSSLGVAAAAGAAAVAQQQQQRSHAGALVAAAPPVLASASATVPPSQPLLYQTQPQAVPTYPQHQVYDPYAHQQQQPQQHYYEAPAAAAAAAGGGGGGWNSFYSDSSIPPAYNPVAQQLGAEAAMAAKANSNSNTYNPSPTSKPVTTDGKKKKIIRHAGGETWEDETLADWDPNDFRVFVGDIDPSATEQMLIRAFQHYPSFQKAKLIPHRVNKQKNRGYGFVSFKDVNDFIRAMKEMKGKYIGNRPISLRRSDWQERNIDVAKKTGHYLKAPKVFK